MTYASGNAGKTWDQLLESQLLPSLHLIFNGNTDKNKW